MSHFSVMVIGDEPENQLAPFQENNMGDCPQEFLVFNDTEDEWRNDYETGYNNLTPFKECYKTFEEYCSDWQGQRERDEKTGRYGYWENPNAKWDWFQLGGRWSGLIKLKEGAEGVRGAGSLVMQNEPGIDQAVKRDIANFGELKTHAIIKDGKWYERGSMGWWGVVHDEKDDNEWDSEYEKLIKGLPDDTLISIIDCHI